MGSKQTQRSLGAVVALAVGIAVVGAAVSSTSEAQGPSFATLRPGKVVPIAGRKSPNVESVALLGTTHGQAFYRVHTRGQSQCFGVGPADHIGTLGNFACGFDDFPSGRDPVVYDAVVGADGPPRTLTKADMRLYRLNVIAADGIAAVEVAGKRLAVTDNIASIAFDEPQPLGVITARDTRGNVVDTYDLRPEN